MFVLQQITQTPIFDNLKKKEKSEQVHGILRSMISNCDDCNWKFYEKIILPIHGP